MFGKNKYLLNNKYIFAPDAKSLTNKLNNDEVTWLGNNESNVLLAFVERPNQILSRDKLHELVWTDKGFYVDESSVIQSISTVRKLLKDSAKEPSFIKTIPKHGYQFIAEAEELSAELPTAIPVEDNIGNESQLTDEVAIPSSPKKNKPSKNKVLSTFILLLSIAILTVGLYWAVNPANSQYQVLYEANKIGDITINTLNEQESIYNISESTRYCVNTYIENLPSDSGVRQVIAAFTSKGHVSLSIVNDNPLKSHTMELIATDKDIFGLCDKRLKTDEK